MKIVRAFKVAIKNLLRFQPGSFALLKSSVPVPGQEMVSKTNIFVVTSCINTYDNINYINHNVSHSPEQRLSETITGLESIKEYYPDAFIIFIESSKIPGNFKELIIPHIDRLFDYSEDLLINIARKHYNKGVPQFTALIKFLEENYNSYEAATVHFLGGRYMLGGNEANKWCGKGSYFLHFPVNDNVSTRYFFTKGIQLNELIRPFRMTLYFAMFGNSVEDVIHGYMPGVHTLHELKVNGLVNGKELIQE